ncbi:hypothetical protein [Streptomyces corynorhini]|uniref:Uncharacterized protein n=1 Tax=Streptomyces corynorhini TaxID=2282652 RepID=A0A370BB49_9ACTN|nr:hypothetical protein [Streptomyces corynorhini]RDG37043.1 hypothetical protein DVH02_16780 [Streptomyces corynorhini]
MSEKTVSPPGSEPVSEPEPVAGSEPEPVAGSEPAAGALDGPAPRPPRRLLRAAARWTVAAAVFAGVGTGAAFGVSGMEREQVPGLSTRDDGRWEYPELSLPALPVGSPRPFSKANTGEIHHADLRELLLPAPAGATPDKKRTGGWVSTDQYVSEYAEDRRAELRPWLRDLAVRHVAARGWTMPDGTAARIYLLRFPSVAFAQTFAYEATKIETGEGLPLATAPQSVLDEEWLPDSAAGAALRTMADAYVEPEPYGATQTRHAYIVAGDTLALIVQERKGGSPAVPFHQTTILQNQLLG